MSNITYGRVLELADGLPKWDELNLAEYIPLLKLMIQRHKQLIEDNLDDHVGNYTYDNLMDYQEQIGVIEHNFSHPFSHLQNVDDTDERRQAVQESIPLWSEYQAWMLNNTRLYEAFKSINLDDLDDAESENVRSTIEEFETDGVNLPTESKQRLESLSTQISTLKNHFGNNVLDSEENWCMYVNKEDLVGVPQQHLDDMKSDAEEYCIPDKYRVSIKYPKYLPILLFCENRELRKQIHQAISTRSSELFLDGDYDNTSNFSDILAARAEKSNILGYKNFNEYTLADRLASCDQEVYDKFSKIADTIKDRAAYEHFLLVDFAKSIGIDDMQDYDVAFVTEKFKQTHYNINEEVIKQYFPTETTIVNALRFIEGLYNIKFSLNENVITYNDTVKYFDVIEGVDNDEPQVIGGLFADLYSRSGKSGGAWMDECLSKTEDQIPVAYVCCNFENSTESSPSLMRLNDVNTLFHELGHALHHILTEVEVPSLCGTNGVPWDAVELPSQMMEFFLTDERVINQVSGHYQSGDPLPNDLLQSVLAVENLGAASAYLRNINFSLIDLKLHQLTADELVDIHLPDYVTHLRSQFHTKYLNYIPFKTTSRFLWSFNHLFSGGYGAGYYSYLWAELYAADVFTAFQEDDTISPNVAAKWREEILSQGGVYDINERFEEFRGRPLSNNSLLRLKGLI